MKSKHSEVYKSKTVNTFYSCSLQKYYFFLYHQKFSASLKKKKEAFYMLHWQSYTNKYGFYVTYDSDYTKQKLKK